MRFRLALALLVSVILIGAASWSRFLTADPTQPGIAVVDQFGEQDEYSAVLLQEFLKPKTTSATSSNDTLTNTDLIGRQLIMDYVGLAASGGAGIESINALAERYVESIPTLNNAPKISYLDINIVTNTKTNFENYSNELVKIYARHSESIDIASASVNDITSLNNIYYAFAKNTEKTYGDTAQELKNLPVPNSLATAHLKLVNKFLSNVTAMKSIYDVEEDPVMAIAGLITVKDNMEEEIVILEEIEQILRANGI